ncbi:ras-2 protein [Stylonychia lemnae]|uniref:Ras-2 protein n=1 Tax=Stylonychia lemnae TaxID=5949 RepID=A0A078AMT6_STYLE|nr:ras-2 protein [Stylonychia lemnae]|eukprot:CDW82188.1 ras-2 protein [Stylonychia lemnae]
MSAHHATNIKMADLLSKDAAQDSNSIELYQEIMKKLQYYLNPKHPLNSKAIQDFREMLANPDPKAKQEFFANHQSHLMHTPAQLKLLFKDNPTYKVEYSIKQPRLGQMPHKRITTEPKLSITKKAIIRPMNKEEVYSAKECQLYENFQLFSFYLSSVLYSIIPFFQDVTRLRVAESGRFAYVEDPIQQLRWDQMIRHMNESIFPEMKILLLKFISQRFQNQSEEQFIDVVDAGGISEFLENQEVSLLMKKYIEELKSLTTFQNQDITVEQEIKSEEQIDKKQLIANSCNLKELAQFSTEINFISKDLDFVMENKLIKKSENPVKSNDAKEQDQQEAEETISLDFIIESGSQNEANTKKFGVSQVRRSSTLKSIIYQFYLKILFPFNAKMMMETRSTTNIKKQSTSPKQLKSSLTITSPEQTRNGIGQNKLLSKLESKIPRILPKPTPKVNTDSAQNGANRNAIKSNQNQKMKVKSNDIIMKQKMKKIITSKNSKLNKILKEHHQSGALEQTPFQENKIDVKDVILSENEDDSEEEKQEEEEYYQNDEDEINLLEGYQSNDLSESSELERLRQESLRQRGQEQQEQRYFEFEPEEKIRILEQDKPIFISQTDQKMMKSFQNSPSQIQQAKPKDKEQIEAEMLKELQMLQDEVDDNEKVLLNESNEESNLSSFIVPGSGDLIDEISQRSKKDSSVHRTESMLLEKNINEFNFPRGHTLALDMMDKIIAESQALKKNEQNEGNSDLISQEFNSRTQSFELGSFRKQRRISGTQDDPLMIRMNSQMLSNENKLDYVNPSSALEVNQKLELLWQQQLLNIRQMNNDTYSSEDESEDNLKIKKTQMQIQMEQDRKAFARDNIQPIQIQEIEKMQKDKAKLYKEFSLQQKEHAYVYMESDKFDQSSARNKFFKSYTSKLLMELILLSFIDGYKMHSLTISDYEVSKSQMIFHKMLELQPKCHEAYFGIAKNYFYIRDFDRAKENFQLAIKYKKDAVYMIWLGFNNLYRSLEHNQQVQNQELTDQEKQQCVFDMNKSLVDSFNYLSRCSKNKDEGFFACFGILRVIIESLKMNQPIRNAKEPEIYANRIKEYDTYYGYLAWSLIYMYIKEDKEQLGIDVLKDLIDENPSRPEAYVILWNYCNQQGNQLVNSLDLAERLFLFAVDYICYQEKQELITYDCNNRLLITEIYAKTLFMSKDYNKLFTLLQLEYSKAPHYTCLLYLYGKYVVQSGELEFYGSGIGALEECMRTTLLPRHKNAKVSYLYFTVAQFFIGYAFDVMNRKLKAYKQTKCYYRIKSLIEMIEELKDSNDANQIKYLKDQNLFYLHQKLIDYDPFEAEIFKAIFQYKVYEGFLEYLRFLISINNLKAAQQLSQIILDRLDMGDQISTTLWVESHIQIAKLDNKSNRIEDALKTLLKLRQVLPPIDLKQIKEFRLPFDFDKYYDFPLSEKFQQKMFRQDDLYVIEEKDEDFTRSVIPQLQMTSMVGVNKNHSHTAFANIQQDNPEEETKQVHQSVLSELNNDNVIQEEDELEYEGFDNITPRYEEKSDIDIERSARKSHSQYKKREVSNNNRNRRSIAAAVGKSLSSIMYFNNNAFENIYHDFNNNNNTTNTKRSSVRHSQISEMNDLLAINTNQIVLDDDDNFKDSSFSVYSNPKFLYLIGKMCARAQSQIFADLALHDCDKILKDIYQLAFDIGGRLFDKYQDVYCSLNKVKGFFRPKNLTINYFYPENADQK